MIKKLIKYGKIAMALVLISALALPSYATVGASDGSAFVTKAEFDAALSDFNARLTTFEAGINSKIDSQVSSYLDRNGIWQGKEQSLQTVQIETGIIADEEIGTVYEETWYIKDAQIPDGTMTDYKGGVWHNTSRHEMYYCLIKNIGKTGLAVIDLEVCHWPKRYDYTSLHQEPSFYEGLTDNDIRHLYMVYNTNSTAWASVQQGAFVRDVRFYESDTMPSEEGQEVQPENSLQLYGQPWSLEIITQKTSEMHLHSVYIKNAVFFFVHKNKTLNWSLVMNDTYGASKTGTYQGYMKKNSGMMTYARVNKIEIY